MKELESPIQDKKLQATEIVAEQEKKKEIKLIGRQRVIRGHICWQYHTITKILTRAKFKKQNIALTSLDPKTAVKIKIHNRVDIEDGCIYFQSLNRKNAIKHLRKMKCEVVEGI